MKVGLIDVDGHNFPNIPLMAITANIRKMIVKIMKNAKTVKSPVKSGSGGNGKVRCRRNQ